VQSDIRAEELAQRILTLAEIIQNVTQNDFDEQNEEVEDLREKFDNLMTFSFRMKALDLNGEKKIEIKDSPGEIITLVGDKFNVLPWDDKEVLSGTALANEWYDIELKINTKSKEVNAKVSGTFLEGVQTLTAVRFMKKGVSPTCVLRVHPYVSSGTTECYIDDVKLTMSPVTKTEFVKNETFDTWTNKDENEANTSGNWQVARKNGIAKVQPEAEGQSFLLDATENNDPMLKLNNVYLNGKTVFKFRFKPLDLNGNKMIQIQGGSKRIDFVLSGNKFGLLYWEAGKQIINEPVTANTWYDIMISLDTETKGVKAIIEGEFGGIKTAKTLSGTTVFGETFGASLQFHPATTAPNTNCAMLIDDVSVYKPATETEVITIPADGDTNVLPATNKITVAFDRPLDLDTIKNIKLTVEGEIDNIIATSEVLNNIDELTINLATPLSEGTKYVLDLTLLNDIWGQPIGKTTRFETKRNGDPAIKFPLDNSEYKINMPITLKANAGVSSNDVTQMKFFTEKIGGIKESHDGVLVNDLYTFDWTPTEGGVYNVSSEVTTAIGTKTSKIIHVNVVENQLPIVTLGDIKVNDITKITANATDADGTVTEAILYINGEQFGNALNTKPYEWAVPCTKEGLYEAYVKAKDDSGEYGFSPSKIFSVAEMIKINEVSEHFDYATQGDFTNKWGINTQSSETVLLENGAVKIESSSKKEPYCDKTFGSILKGKYAVSAKFTPSDNTHYRKMFSFRDNNNKEGYLMKFGNDGNIYIGKKVVGPYDGGVSYILSGTVNFELNTASITISGGNKTYTVENEPLFLDWGFDGNLGVKFMRFAHQGSDGTTSNIILDDIIVDKLVEDFALDSISAYTLDCKTIETITRLPRNTDKLILKFNKAINDTTLNGQVTIKDSLNNILPVTISIDSTKKIVYVTFENLLDAGKEYICTLGTGIKSEGGSGFKQEQIVKMRTVFWDVALKNNTIKKVGNFINGTISYESTANKEASIFVSLYKDNVLIETFVKQQMLKTRDNVDFKIPFEGTLDKTYSIKAFVWENDAKPIAESLDVY
ncbi:MAG: Ig-like domain-containing protein, partial [Oscillospiraceae bacterium]